MAWGLGAAITWAFDTVILSIALMSSTFFSTEQAIALASFTSTFLHDGTSAILMAGYMGVRRKLAKTWQLLRSKTGALVIVAAVIGAPLGMSGYVFAINQIGAAYTCAITAFFPAYGALLAHFVLKERMKSYQWIGLMVCLVAVAVLSFNPDEAVPGNWVLGVIGALVCVVGWGTEAVIISYALRFGDADDECCLQIRQTTSMVCYMAIILPVLGGWGCAIDALTSPAMPIIALAAVIGTASYLFYYKAIDNIGASKSMALNISYSGWSIPVALILLGTIPTPTGIICALAIIGGSVVASTDVRELVAMRDTTIAAEEHAIETVEHALGHALEEAEEIVEHVKADAKTE